MQYELIRVETPRVLVIIDTFPGHGAVQALTMAIGRKHGGRRPRPWAEEANCAAQIWAVICDMAAWAKSMTLQTEAVAIFLVNYGAPRITLLQHLDRMGAGV